MKFFLLKMFLSGIKNIDKEIEISFYKDTLRGKFDSSNSHVKAIYGANGAGKTGIMYAVEIYKNLLLDNKYLTVCNANGSLESLINKNTQELYIKMIYLCEEEGETNKVFSHYIKIKKVNNEFKFIEEELSKLSGTNLNSKQKYITIYRIVDGKFEYLPKNCKYVEELKAKTMNLLSSQSFVCAAIDVNNLKNINDLKMDYNLLLAALYLMTFCFSIIVVLQKSDEFINYNDVYLSVKKLFAQKKQKSNEETLEELYWDDNLFGNRFSFINCEHIRKDKFSEYEKSIANLCSFLRVFNNNLERIELTKDENGDYYECEKIMVYKDKRINEKFESTGIRKLIKLYYALCELNRGKIVFIDEFDANLHDVLLEKLILYIMQYAKGQFVFTTHNLGPMDILKSASNSIDFLSSDSMLISWSKNGNYTPASQYRKGLIKYSPFNIESFSFIGVFGDK